MSKSKTLYLVVFGVVAIALTWGVLTMPDQRSTGDRLGDAVDSLTAGQGADKAVRQLEPRTPGEKLGDAVKDAGQDLKNATQQ